MAIASRAAAHPAGFTSVNRYLGLDCGAGGVIHVAYLVDFAEMPAYAELDALDTDHDGRVSPEEQRAYLERRVPSLLDRCSITVDGVRAALRVRGSNLAIQDGAQGMSTLRIAVAIDAERDPPVDPERAEIHVEASDVAFADRPGWREMAGSDSADAVLVAGIKERPADALAYGRPDIAPPRVDRATFAFRLAPHGTTPEKIEPPLFPVAVDARIANLARAMRRAETSPSFSLVALGIALLLGAAHALSPGHGKLLAAAVLTGRRARIGHAFTFGATVAVAHTAVVFLTGVLAVAVEHTVSSHRFVRGLETAAAVTVLVLGVVQLSSRLREAASPEAAHEHAPLAVPGGDRFGLVALGASAGIVPCPSGLAILFGAIALHRYGLGLVLVFAFSAGVALTLTAVSAMVVAARRLVDRVGARHWIVRLAPVGSSAVVTVLGVLLCASALSSR
jgi:ABC-type nickel/cobalt efflux system permease component RcnA